MNNVDLQLFQHLGDFLLTSVNFYPYVGDRFGRGCEVSMTRCCCPPLTSSQYAGPGLDGNEPYRECRGLSVTPLFVRYPPCLESCQSIRNENYG
jgi:hypothetical protein